MHQTAALATRTGRRLVYKNEGRGRQRLSSITVPPRITFGVELELFFPSDVNVDTLQQTLRSNGVGSGWRIKNDNSIVCNPRVPSCYKAELVSPVLRGQQGLEGIFGVLNAIKRHNPSVNNSTGLHVHLPELKRLAHNFAQLETGFDLLMPKSRRANTNSYCRSNLAAAMSGNTRTKKDALGVIKNTISLDGLRSLVSPDRYMKMNLMALDRHGTVEFRHAGGSQNAAKAVAYVLLWALLPEASADRNRSLARQAKKGYVFEHLLGFHAHSPVLVHWLTRRRLELNPKGSSSSGGRASNGSAGCSAGCGCSDCRSGTH